MFSCMLALFLRAYPSNDVASEQLSSPERKTAQSVWQACLDLAKAELSAQSFNTWFGQIRAVKLEEDVLTIEVPSLFFYEWIEEYYISLIKRALDVELGEGARLEYSILVDKGNRRNKPLSMQLKATNLSKPAPAEQPTEVRPIAQPKSRAASHNPFELPSVEEAQRIPNLKAEYTFDRFMESDCNRVAYAAGLTIAQRPGNSGFNPLVIYGGTGLGKTHLAQAIGAQILQHFPGRFVLYVSAEQFTQQFIEALKTNTAQQFTHFYMQVDVLIVDDVQSLNGKEKTQENFFHIFNYLHQSGKQIIMTCDEPPASLKGLQERLLSRFKWGLIADMRMPDYETRVRLVRRKMAEEGMVLSDDIVEYIARRVDSSIRELEGAVVSVVAHASFRKSELSMDLAKSILDNLLSQVSHELTIGHIQQTVAGYYDLLVEDLCSKGRKKEIVLARQMAMYFCHQYTKEALKNIGEAFGGRDHTTVIHANKSIGQKAETDASFNQMVVDIKGLLGVK